MVGGCSRNRSGGPAGGAPRAACPQQGHGGVQGSRGDPTPPFAGLGMPRRAATRSRMCARRARGSQGGVSRRVVPVQCQCTSLAPPSAPKNAPKCNTHEEPNSCTAGSTTTTTPDSALSLGDRARPSPRWPHATMAPPQKPSCPAVLCGRVRGRSITFTFRTALAFGSGGVPCRMRSQHCCPWEQPCLGTDRRYGLPGVPPCRLHNVVVLVAQYQSRRQGPVNRVRIAVVERGGPSVATIPAPERCPV